MPAGPTDATTTPRPVTQSEPVTGRMLRILPLGGGLVLIGLGLALAFVALRLRRS
ncbi:hypothetical protein GCM10010508_08530 [Streptomyces naganishii JCM 4654]|uniref:Uncharacterized protein n=1 Tax=Streptomyces naganishii JCM 4654 TaxID=1306179 RepID=A0A919CTD8_9ACTN|nr:hypothetical protein GCM10010508_08530 [Streptomyces naganishii JCM 4654]